MKTNPQDREGANANQQHHGGMIAKPQHQGGKDVKPQFRGGMDTSLHYGKTKGSPLHEGIYESSTFTRGTTQELDDMQPLLEGRQRKLHQIQSQAAYKGPHTQRKPNRGRGRGKRKGLLNPAEITWREWLTLPMETLWSANSSVLPNNSWDFDTLATRSTMFRVEKVEKTRCSSLTS